MYGNANVVANLAALSSNPVSTTGNITAGNFNTSGLISATGNVQSGNLRTTGLISATGNVTAGNVSATNITGTLTTASQTNVTTLGTLTALTVSGQANFDGQLKIPTSPDATPVAGSIYFTDSAVFGGTTLNIWSALQGQWVSVALT